MLCRQNQKYNKGHTRQSKQALPKSENEICRISLGAFPKRTETSYKKD